jgi:hypothetical protein
MPPNNENSKNDKLDRIVADAQRNKVKREQGYREQSLKLYAWICGRCMREFTRINLQELTVHHRDHNHDNNPADGSNWELLCIYCHENEHARYLDAVPSGSSAVGKQPDKPTDNKPFADLKALLKKKE